MTITYSVIIALIGHFIGTSQYSPIEVTFVEEAVILGGRAHISLRHTLYLLEPPPPVAHTSGSNHMKFLSNMCETGTKL